MSEGEGGVEPDYEARMLADIMGVVRHGFRRRCAWCCVTLRGWQLNTCRLCTRSLTEPPCARAARIDEEPDRWVWWWRL